MRKILPVLLLVLGLTAPVTLYGQQNPCGNGKIDVESEQCDGTDLGDNTCQDLEFAGGTLGCNDQCQFDTTNCTNDICTIDAPLSVEGTVGQTFSFTIHSSVMGANVCIDEPDLVFSGATLPNGDATFQLTCTAPVDTRVAVEVTSDPTCGGGYTNCPPLHVICVDEPEDEPPPVIDTPSDGPSAPPLFCTGWELDDKIWCPALGSWVTLNGATLPWMDDLTAINPLVFIRSMKILEYLRNPEKRNAEIAHEVAQHLNNPSEVEPPLLFASLRTNIGTTSAAQPTSEPPSIFPNNPEPTPTNGGTADLYDTGTGTDYARYFRENFVAQDNGSVLSKSGGMTPLLPSLGASASALRLSSQTTTDPNRQDVIISLYAAGGAIGGGCSLVR